MRSLRKDVVVLLILFTAGTACAQTNELPRSTPEAEGVSSKRIGIFLSPIFIDIYGESFLWNMVRKMMRVFVDVSSEKMSLDDVEKLLNPCEGDPRASIKVLESDYLILMDIMYDGIKFEYDSYACERFRRYLVDSLIIYKRNMQ